MTWNVVYGEWNKFIDKAPWRDICTSCRELEIQEWEARLQREQRVLRWELDVGMRAHMRLHTYEPRNKSQAAAHAAAWGLVEKWKEKLVGSLWLWSTTYGLGKTHLTYALLWEATQLGYSVAVWDEVSLLTEIRATYNTDSGESKWTEDKLLEHAGHVDVLAWDDMGRGYVRTQSMPWYRGIVYKVLNIRYDAARPIIVTSNMDPDQLPGHIGGAAFSRLKGLCPQALRLEGEDYRISG